MIVHRALRVSHCSRRIAVKRIVGPKRAADETDVIDDDFGVLKQVDAKPVSQILPAFRLIAHRERLPIGIPFVVAGNIDDRAARGAICQPANPFAQRIMDVASGNQHIKFWGRIGNVPIALLDMKIGKDPDAHDAEYSLPNRQFTASRTLQAENEEFLGMGYRRIPLSRNCQSSIFRLARALLFGKRGVR